MGKRWKPYRVGIYRLGLLGDQAVATWRDAEGRHRFRLGRATSEEQARGLITAFAHARARQTAVTDGATIGAIFAAYQKDREVDGKQVAAFAWNWKALSATFANVCPEDLTADLCRSYAAARLADGVQAGTVWTELTRLRSALNWAAKRRLIQWPPPYVWTPTKPAARERVLTDDEVDRLLAGAVMPHVRLFVTLALCTGARSSALLELTWDRVDLEAGLIDLRRPEPVNPLTKKVRKGRAIVPMNSTARAVLSQANAESISDHVIEWNGGPILKIRKGFEEARKRAGLDGVTPHDLRRTAATWADEAGIDPQRIARLLGHSNVASGEAYRHPRPEALRQAADVLDIRKRRSS
jgi:integrase